MIVEDVASINKYWCDCFLGEDGDHMIEVIDLKVLPTYEMIAGKDKMYSSGDCGVIMNSLAFWIPYDFMECKLRLQL